MNKGAKDRVVLEGVPRVCFEPHEGKVECTPFPSSLRAVLEYMGEDYPYEYLMGVSGAAFRMVWKPEEWDPGNVDIILMADNPREPFDRALEAVGYTYELYGNAAKNHEKDPWFDWMKLVGEYKAPELLKTRTVESINADKPVIGFGVIGPPEACVIAGYDKQGAELLGWNFFQQMPEFAKGAEKEESGYFRKPDWAKDTGAMMFLGEKKDKPETADIYHKALKWALDVIRTPQIKDHHTGLAAYETWAEFMQRDRDFPDDMKVLTDRNMCFNDGMTMLAEGRWYASLFLSLAARHLPMKASHLLAAASCFAKEHEIAWDIWGLMGGYGWEEEKVRKLADPQVRRGIAELILKARDADAEAAEHIEKALEE